MGSPIPPGNPYLVPASDLTLYAYNPDEARTLLTNAGWVDTNGDGIGEKDGQELAFTFKTTINPMRTIAAQIFRENMEAIGIRITVIQESPGMLFGDNGSLVRGEFDIAEFAWGTDLEGVSILDLYRTIDEQNFGAYDNPEYDAVLEAFQNAGSEEEQLTTAYQAQQIFTPDSTLTGKATFGFVSKYQKGAKVPTGNTEFQFKVADLNFKSTSYDWLVIAGSKAQYKGTGTINGAGEYGFMLTATDGSPDKFRIKIWDKATGEVIYDNQLGAADDANPTTAIQGGSIVIHKSK